MRYMILLLIFCYTLESLCAEPATTYKIEAGTLSVKTIDELKVLDKQRNKTILAKVYYPDGAGPFPVIIFSHGFTANKDAFTPVAEYWASHGYVSIHPQHDDARTGLNRDNLQLDSTADATESTPPNNNNKALPGLGKQRQLGGLLQGANGPGGSPEQIENRIRDVIAMIDELAAIEKGITALTKKIDRDKIAVAGHSYGAFLSMVLGGATIDINGKSQSFADSRIKCIVPISGAGTGEFGLTNDSWKNCTLPAFYVIGTRDTRPGHPNNWRREPFTGSPSGDKYLLTIEGATHFHYGGGPGRGNAKGLLANRDSTLTMATNLTKQSTLVFLDSYLKGNQAALAFLKNDLAGTYKQQAVLEAK